MTLIRHGLTAALNYTGIQRLAGFGRLVGPLAQSVLYPQCIIRDAIPKYISRRTSYPWVCLAFHSDPQLIR